MTLTLFDYIEAPVTEIETRRLSDLEERIERGLQTFVDVGMALLEIRDGRLYRKDYNTFEDYLYRRWDMSRPRAYQLMDAATVTNGLSTIVDKLPANEAQARPLASLPPEQQAPVWARVVETAPDGKITAAHVQSVVDEIKSPHVTHNSGNNEWYTPQEYIEAARVLMGEIDLDPASSDIANQTVRATIYYTADDDGLRYSWDGRVWMNPPYSGDLIGKFCEKLVKHYCAREIADAVVLVNNATETRWFQGLLSCASAVCLLEGRVKFIDTDGNPSGAPLQGQAILYFGERKHNFCNLFSEFGSVLYVAR